MRVEDIKVKEINSDSALNCRGDIAPIDVHGLAQDIKENGLMMPIIVMIYTDEEAKTHGKKYRLIAGFRRYAAHKLIKQELISASIREPMTEMDSRIFNLNENIQREDLNIKQEAKALKILKDLGMNRDEAARKLGKSPGWVQIRFMLLALPEVIQEEAAAGIIIQSQIRDLYTIHNKEGEAAMFSAVRGIKDAKAKGEKVQLQVDRKVDKNKKPQKERKRNEIFAMMDHIQEYFPNGLYTRCLAWASGEISYNELYESLKEHAVQEGLPYSKPTD